jgi:RHS repeat-associated protein
MATPQQSEKRASHFALAKAPDWKYTPKKPNKGVPVPYITISYFNEAVNVANQSNGRTHDYFISTSRVPKSHNGEAGLGKGVKSGAYTDEFEPTEWSKTLQIDQGFAVFTGHTGTINKGNAPAKVYAGVTVAEAVADKACWETLKTNLEVLGTTTKDKLFEEPMTCGADAFTGLKNSVKSDAAAAAGMLESIWGVISSPVESAKSLANSAVGAYDQAKSLISGIKDGSITMQDLLDLVEAMGEKLLCDIGANLKKMIEEGKGCEAAGFVMGQVATTVALTLATGGAGGAAGALGKMGIKQGDNIADMIKKVKEFKKKKKDGTDASKPKPHVDEKKDANTPKDGNNPDVCPLCPTVANPVNPVLGVKVQADERELDFDLPAPFPMPWQRCYVSSNARVGWLGQGWTIPITASVEERKGRFDEMYFYFDEFGREIPFSHVAEGQSDFNRYEQITLLALPNRRLEIRSADGAVRYLFAPLGISESDPKGSRGKLNKRFVLVGMVDRNDQVIRLTYSDDGLPQYLFDSAGRTIGLGFQGLAKADIEKQIPVRLTRVAELRRAGNTAQGSSNGVEIIDLARYEYNAQGDLITVRGRLGQITRQFQYRNHILVGHSQPSGASWRYEYDNGADTPDPKSRVTLTESQLGERYTFDYQANETIVIDQLGREERYLVQFDNDGKRRWGGTIDALGGKTLRALDEWGNLTALTDPAGRQTQYRYDALGNPVEIKTPGTTALDFASTRVSYHGQFSLPVQITDAMGSNTAYEYDERGNLTSVTDAQGNVTRYTIDARGLIAVVTDATGKDKFLEYNAAGQVTRYTDCSGNATLYRYDENSHLAGIADALGNDTRYAHDMLGRLQSVAHPDGSSEHFEYDNLGRLTAYTDPLGAKTQYSLAPDGLPLARKNALGGALEYEYDGARRLSALVNENRARYHFNYDPLDRLTEESGFDGRTTRYAYDASGLPTQKLELGTLSEAQRIREGDKRPTPSGAASINPIPSQRSAPTFDDPWGLGIDPLDAAAHRLPFGAIHTRYGRDAAGRLAQKLVARAGAQETPPAQAKAQAETQTAPQVSPQTLRTHYTYDALGRLTQASNDAGSKIALAYDALGQLIAETSHHRGEPSTLAHAYDALGNRTQTTLPTRESVNHLYYGSGHLHQVNLDGEILCDIERDALYRETQRTQGALTSRYGYDAMGRLQAQGAYRNTAQAGSGLANPKANANPGRWEALGDIGDIGTIRGNGGTNPSANKAEIDPRTALGKIVIGRRYDYDRAGNLKQISDNRNGATNYHYDVLGRILGAGQKGLSETFAFDPAHNIVDLAGAGTASGASAKPIPAAQNNPNSSNISQKSAQNAPQVSHAQSTTASATTQAKQGSAGLIRNNRLEVFEDKRYQYDTHGNLIQKKIGSHTIIALSWDAEHQLTQSVVTRHANDPKRKTTQRTHYRYDAFGRRVEKKDHFGLTHFIWDGNRLLSETRGSHTRTYVYEPDSFAPLAQIEHQAEKLPLPAGEGWGEGSASDKESNRSAPNAAQTTEQFPLDDEALDNPRQAAARFQAMMQAKASQIKGAVALAHAQHAAANDPDRTRPIQSVPGSAIKRALATGGNATTSEATHESANETPSESRNKARSPKRYRVSYFHNDHLGTPRELSSEQGEIQWAATYKAWGNTLKVEWVAQQTQPIPAAQNEAKREQNRDKNSEETFQENAQPLRFQGQYYDNETGLHYNRFRYYDPDCGRFVSQDPIGLAGGSNLFMYAPNATGWTDPFGLKIGCCKDPCPPVDKSKPPIIMGENMDRVKAYAEQVGGKVYSPWKNDPFDVNLGMKRNERWIQDQMKQGRQLIDVGPDFDRREQRRAAGRQGESPFYEMERKNVANNPCANYQKVFTRNGKRGGVPALGEAP